MAPEICAGRHFAAGPPAARISRMAEQPVPITSILSRRALLRGVAVTGGGLVAASLAACAPRGGARVVLIG
jgi:hypothetical protein